MVDMEISPKAKPMSAWSAGSRGRERCAWQPACVQLSVRAKAASNDGLVDPTHVAMPIRPVAMQELQVPVADIKRMTEQERFAYYLLGHMFNELMCLQKLVAYALPKHEDVRDAVRQPEMGQALFLFRLACGKLWEVRAAINQREVSETLRQRVFVAIKDGADRLKAVNKAIESTPWLSKMRNRIGFHFPTFADWQGLIAPDDGWVPDRIFLGRMTGNTFYAGSDAIAQSWMFGLHGAADLRDAIDPMLVQMIDLLRLVNSFLEDVVGAFVADVVLSGAVLPTEVGEILAPDFVEVSLPFWTAMPAESGSS